MGRYDETHKIIIKRLSAPYWNQARYLVLKRENDYNENLLRNVYLKKLLYIVNIRCGLP